MIQLASIAKTSTIEAVLCDADGCLFPSEEPAFDASAAVTNEFLAAIGSTKRFSGEALRLATTGKNFRATAATLAEVAGLPLDRAELERWVSEERRQVTAHLSRVLAPDREVIDPLVRLGVGQALAVVSSSALPRVEVCLDATGLSAIFPRENIFSAEDSLPRPSSKPDPAIYRLAGESLGISPRQGLAIEDSLPGAQAAIAAGFPTVGNLAFVPPSERVERAGLLSRAGVLALVSSWREIEQLLDSPQPAPA
jgi:beta-phosphoglucomutase-like phosphatase (HAD superfamily)